MLARVADCLYWMSRYLERAEHTGRALNVQLDIALDEAPWSASIGWVCLLGALRVDMPLAAIADARAITATLAVDRAQPASIVNCLGHARENARQIRESITSDVWEEINRIHLSLRSLQMERLWSEGADAVLQSVYRGGQMVAGVIDSTMSHGEGWQFVRVGRFIERAILVTWLLEEHFGMKGVHSTDDGASEKSVAWSGLLRSCCAFEPFCKAHSAELRPRQILQFLLLDAEFPHSVRFAVDQVAAAVEALARWTGTPRECTLHRRIGRLASELAYVTIDDIMARSLRETFGSIVSQCIHIHDALHRQYVGYTVDAALSGRRADEQ